MRHNLLLVLLLAVVASGCASSGPMYYGLPEVRTPVPPLPAPEETVVVIDDLTIECPPELHCDPKLAATTASPRPPAAPTPNLWGGKINKQLAPHIKIDWKAGSKQPTPSIPKSITKPAPSTEVLKSQINNLLAQVDSLQNVVNDRRPAKLERYARELATAKAELLAVSALRDKALDEIVLLKQSEAITRAKLTKTHDLLAATRGGYMQWNLIARGQSQDKAADPQDWIIMGTLSFIVLTGFMFGLGWRHGRIKATRDVQARIAALKGAIEGRNFYIRELREKLGRKRRRIQEIKRKRAGPLPESSDRDEPPESVFGPLDRDDS